MAIRYLPAPTGNSIGNRGRVHIIASRPRTLSREERLYRVRLAIGIFLIAAAAAAILFAIVKVRSIAAKLPPIGNLADTRIHPLTRIVSSDGVLLASFETHYRRPVPLGKISHWLVDATVATEDARFYGHSGVDAKGIARAAVANISAGRWTAQGGSTITQQLARNLYLSNQKTLERKVEETLLAREIERRFKKQEILEAYLNTIYYGEGCYGAEAASQAYFHKPATDLNLGEAALLAGLPQRPAAYSPVQHLPEALRRRSDVLKRMAVTGKISTEEAARAEAEPVTVSRPRLVSQADWKAPYFVAHVLSILREQFGSEFLYSGVCVVTTLNWRMQKAAEQSLREGLRQGYGPNTGCLVALDPRSGAIRALVGGPDFRRNQFDAATQGIRQPGSAFKPIVYAAAFDTNVCSLVNMVEDKKLTYEQPPKNWVVHNYDDRYRGPVSVLDAIRQSINTVAVQIADQTGPTTIQTYARELGIMTPMTANLPLALGASGVHPIDLCSAVTAFANGGSRYTPYAIRLIQDGQHNEVYRDDATVRLHPPFLGTDTVDQINLALREVVLDGTGSAAAGVPDAHGKTGTTSSHRDAWFVGYTGSLAAVVWMGHEEKRTSKGGQTAVTYLPMHGATGGRVCAPVWAKFMKSAATIQQRVDLARGVGKAVVLQSDKESLLSRLRESVDRTGLEEARAEEMERSTLTGEASAPIYSWYGQSQPGEPPPPDGTAVVHLQQASSVTTDNDGQSAQEGENGVRPDTDAGYSESDRRRRRQDEQ